MDTYRRLTVLAPASRVDVALPADLPVAELTPMVLELLGEPGPGSARAPVPWRLDGPAGAPLPPAATLAQLGVLDGELLRIGPALPVPAPPVFDDVPEALAATVTPRRADDGLVALGCLLALAGVSGVLASLRGTGLGIAVGGVLAGIGISVALVTAVARRSGGGRGSGGTVGGAAGGSRPGRAELGRTGPGGTRPGPPGAGSDPVAAPGPGPDRRAQVTWALAAIPPAAAAGWLAVPGTPGAAALGAALLGTAAAVGAQAALRRAAPALLAAVLVGLTGSIVATILLVTEGPAAVGGTAAALVGVLAAPALPRIALRLADVPGPGIDGPRGPADPDPGAARLARSHLAGLVLGTAIVVGVGSVLAATSPGPWGPAFAGAACLTLLLRARGFAEPVPARALQTAGVLGGTAGALATSGTAPPGVRLAVAAAAGALLVLAAAVQPTLGPVARRTVDLAELVLTAVCVPLAVFALGLFALIRGW